MPGIAVSAQLCRQEAKDSYIATLNSRLQRFLSEVGVNPTEQIIARLIELNIITREDLAHVQVDHFADILPRSEARRLVEKCNGVNFRTITPNRSLQELELMSEEVQELGLQSHQLIEREQIRLQNTESQREEERNKVEMKKLELREQELKVEMKEQELREQEIKVEMKKLELREQEIKVKEKEDERRAERKTKALENEKQRIENNRIRDIWNLKKDADNSKAIGLGFGTSGLVGVGGAVGVGYATIVAGATVTATIAAAPIVIGAVGSGSAVYGIKKYFDGRSRDKEIADAYSNKRKENEKATGNDEERAASS